MSVSPSASNPQILSNLLAQQRNLEQQQGSTPQTPTGGASPGAAQEATGSSPGSAVRTPAQVRRDALARAYPTLSQASKELVQARKNPRGFSGPEAFLERLKQRLGMATEKPQTGMGHPAGPAKTPIALAPPKAEPTGADLEAMWADLEAQAGRSKADLPTRAPGTLKEPGLMEIPFNEMTIDQQISYMDRVRILETEREKIIASSLPRGTALNDPAGLGATASGASAAKPAAKPASLGSTALGRGQLTAMPTGLVATASTASAAKPAWLGATALGSGQLTAMPDEQLPAMPAGQLGTAQDAPLTGIKSLLQNL